MQYEDSDSFRYQPRDPAELNTIREMQRNFLQDVATSVDVDKVSAFVPPDKIDIGDLTGRLTPDSGPELQVSADLDKLAEELRAAREEQAKRQANEKLARLLDLAQEKIEQKRFPTAIAILDHALELDPTSTQAWMLKGQCHFALGDFRAALEVLAKAREYAQDERTIRFVLALRAVCERNLTSAIESELTALLDQDRLSEALTLVQGALRDQPGSPTLLVHRCGILFLMERFAEARTAAEAALGFVNEGTTADIFRELLSRIALGESREIFEAARQCLRQHDPKGAIKRLRACPPELHGEEQFETLRSYAYERKTRGLFERRREPGVALLAEADRQNLLGWLLREELAAGLKALNQANFATAGNCFDAADKIDNRSHVIAFLHAATIMAELQRPAEQRKAPSLNQIDARLQLAAQLAERATAHGSIMREEGLKLAKAIGENRRALDKIRQVSQLFSRFNNHMSYYQRNPISPVQVPAARRQFQSIRNDVQRVRAGYSPGSFEHGQLTELDAAITKVLGQLS